jgi:hypothetical protein
MAANALTPMRDRFRPYGFWLKAEVNPQPPGGTRAVIESDYSNTSAGSS